MSDIVDRARRNAKVIYVAVAESVADEISGVFVDCADEIDRLRTALATAQAERDAARQEAAAARADRDEWKGRAELWDISNVACRAEIARLQGTIGRGEAVLQAYDMTPKGLAEMADWLASETNGEPECREAEIVAALRSTAAAFTAHEGWLALAVADRARDRAALAEARRVLRESQTFIEYARHELQPTLREFAQFPSQACADTMLAKIAAVLAREEPS